MKLKLKDKIFNIYSGNNRIERELACMFVSQNISSIKRAKDFNVIKGYTDNGAIFLIGGSNLDELYNSCEEYYKSANLSIRGRFYYTANSSYSGSFRVNSLASSKKFCSRLALSVDPKSLSSRYQVDFKIQSKNRRKPSLVTFKLNHLDEVVNACLLEYQSLDLPKKPIVFATYKINDEQKKSLRIKNKMNPYSFCNEVKAELAKTILSSELEEQKRRYKYSYDDYKLIAKMGEIKFYFSDTRDSGIYQRCKNHFENLYSLNQIGPKDIRYSVGYTTSTKASKNGRIKIKNGLKSANDVCDKLYDEI